MRCRVCGSQKLQTLRGEVTVSLTTIEKATLAPVHFNQEFSACLDCGSTELRIPTAQRELLRKNTALGS